MMDWFDDEVRQVALVIGISLVFLIGGIWIMAHFEAKSYRKFCNKPVTTWDAVFLDLRIDECGS